MMTSLNDASFDAARAFLRQSGIDLNDESFPLEVWCNGQAELGLPEAQHAIAKFFHIGMFGENRELLAYEWCCRAADSDYAPALHMLAGFYEDGFIGCATDIEKSTQLLQRAAELSYAPAFVTLALMCLSGDATSQDKNKARMYLERAVALNSSVAQFILGNLLLETGTEPEVANGLMLIQDSALQRNPAAHRVLHHIYLSGKFGTPVDRARSDFHFHEAEEIEKYQPRF